MEISSTIVGHEETKYWNDDETWPKAVATCCQIPSVILPAAIVGIRIRLEKMASA